MLHCEWPGGGVGVGGLVLDEWSEEDDRRIGTAFGLDHIKAILDVIGVDSWEQIAGRRAIALFEGSGGWGARSVGIASADGDRGDLNGHP